MHCTAPPKPTSLRPSPSRAVLLFLRASVFSSVASLQLHGLSGLCPRPACPLSLLPSPLGSKSPRSRGPSPREAGVGGPKLGSKLPAAAPQRLPAAVRSWPRPWSLRPDWSRTAPAPPPAPRPMGAPPGAQSWAARLLALGAGRGAQRGARSRRQGDFGSIGNSAARGGAGRLGSRRPPRALRSS